MRNKSMPQVWQSEGLHLQAYEKIPIYRVARDLTRESHILVARMPKQFKFSLGSQIMGYASELAHSIFIAYEENEDQSRKLEFIKDIGRHTQRLLTSYRIAFDLQLIPRGRDSVTGYTQQVERIVHIIAQHKKWAARQEVTLYKAQQSGVTA